LHVFSRETVKATVFGSNIPPPTITLEEFADQQKAEAIEREKRAKENENQGPLRYFISNTTD